MDRLRRRLLAACSGGIAAALLYSRLGAAQEPLPGPASRRNSGTSREPGTADDGNGPPGQPNAAKAVLEQRQKDIKKDVEKLFDLATQLKAEVEKTDATSVLSMAMVKKAEEIEKLAKQISNHARG
jgi:hypothetical protein